MKQHTPSRRLRTWLGRVRPAPPLVAVVYDNVDERRTLGALRDGRLPRVDDAGEESAAAADTGPYGDGRGGAPEAEV